jgi:acyl-CoA thioester hydrolase
VSPVVRIFSKRFEVPADAVDRQGHVSNVAYVAWMQEVAIEHSAVLGWPMER